jgi:hypothetical protein
MRQELSKMQLLQAEVQRLRAQGKDVAALGILPPINILHLKKKHSDMRISTEQELKKLRDANACKSVQLRDVAALQAELAQLRKRGAR